MAAGDVTARHGRPVSRGRPDRLPGVAEQEPRLKPLVRLLLFHHGGGSIRLFNGWEEALPAWCEPVKLRIPFPGYGLDLQHVDLRELGAHVCAEAEPLLDAPFALFGHSMGGLLAYEVAQHLRPARAPVWMGLSACSPHPPILGPRLSRGSVPTSPEDMASLLRHMDSPVPVCPGSSAWQKSEATVREIFRLGSTLRAEPYGVPVPVSLFAAAEDPLFPRELVRAWEDFVPGPVRLHLLDGGHFYVGERRSALTGMITRDLAAALEVDGR